MAIDYQKLLSKKSDEELQDYFYNCTKYTSETISEVIKEFKHRGKTISEEEINSYRQLIQEQDDKRNEIEKSDKDFWDNGNNLKKNVTTDKEAPIYYSEKAIYTFSTFFSVIFGSVLLAINCRSTENKRGAWQVLLFGVIFTSLQIFLLSKIPRNTILTFVFSTVGALIMNNLFWKKYIGKDTKYRTKPIWKPLLVAVIIFLPIFLFLVFGGPEN
jgi:hypothetical protein